MSAASERQIARQAAPALFLSLRSSLLYRSLSVSVAMRLRDSNVVKGPRSCERDCCMSVAWRYSLKRLKRTPSAVSGV